MLETPTGPRFQVTPVAAPADVHAFAVEGARQLRRQRGVEFQPARTPDTTPINTGVHQGSTQDTTHSSSQVLLPTEDEVTADETSLLESVHHNAEDMKALAGLRDISSLATWTLSSAKPGCALTQLRHPSPNYFWQSDGPQPHTLTLHFFKLVSIVKIRIYLDFKLDESYTPTKIKFFAGMSEGGLVEFANWDVEESLDPETGEPSSSIEKVRGWIEIPLKGVGGRDPRYYELREARKARAYEKRQQHMAIAGTSAMDIEDEEDEDDLEPGDVLRAMLVQVRIIENHQNGKDTHVRGFQVFAKDETSVKEMRKLVKRVKPRTRSRKNLDTDIVGPDERDEIVGLQPAEWMGEPDIR